MANRTAWVAGNGAGFTWTALFSSSATTDINQTGGIATGKAVLSTITISNQTALDQFMDVSMRQGISSSTIAAGANFALYIYGLLDDGSTYGDGQLTAGTPSANTYIPPFPPVGTFPLFATTAQTTLVGFIQGIIIPPGTFKAAILNNSGFTTNATGNVCMYRTYNQNLNS
jgi:hypothetical protein